MMSEEPQMTGRGHAAPGRRPATRAEYRFYFTLILVAALPFEVLGWGAALARRQGWPPKGPFARASTQANTITPLIFSA